MPARPRRGTWPALAKELGIRVHTIALGPRDLANADGEQDVVDTETLREMAEAHRRPGVPREDHRRPRRGGRRHRPPGGRPRQGAARCPCAGTSGPGRAWRLRRCCCAGGGADLPRGSRTRPHEPPREASPSFAPASRSLRPLGALRPPGDSRSLAAGWRLRPPPGARRRSATGRGPSIPALMALLARRGAVLGGRRQANLAAALAAGLDRPGAHRPGRGARGRGDLPQPRRDRDRRRPVALGRRGRQPQGRAPDRAGRRRGRRHPGGRPGGLCGRRLPRRPAHHRPRQPRHHPVRPGRRHRAGPRHPPRARAGAGPPHPGGGRRDRGRRGADHRRRRHRRRGPARGRARSRAKGWRLQGLFVPAPRPACPRARPSPTGRPSTRLAGRRARGRFDLVDARPRCSTRSAPARPSTSPPGGYAVLAFADLGRWLLLLALLPALVLFRRSA